MAGLHRASSSSKVVGGLCGVNYDAKEEARYAPSSFMSSIIPAASPNECKHSKLIYMLSYIIIVFYPDLSSTLSRFPTYHNPSVTGQGRPWLAFL